jgi:hypothetical protein
VTLVTGNYATPAKYAAPASRVKKIQLEALIFLVVRAETPLLKGASVVHSCVSSETYLNNTPKIHTYNMLSH